MIKEDYTKTNVKKNLRLLNENKQMFSVLDNINQIIYINDSETFEVIYANKYLKKLLGEDPTGKKCYSAFRGVNHPCNHCNNKDLLKNKHKVCRWEYYNKILNKHLMVTNFLIKWDNKKYFRFELAIDVTHHKELEDELLKSRERYRLAQKAAEIGSWDWNIKSGELFWSDQIELIFGFKPGDFKGKIEDFFNAIHPEDKIRVKKAINRAIDKDEEYDIEHRIIRPDGSVRWVREKGDVLRNKKGKTERMMGVVLDITDRKKTEDKIMKLNEDLLEHASQLSVVNEELEAFSYSVSHDLRAPLRSIDGFSEALLEDYGGDFDEEGNDYVKRIRKATNKMSRIIDDLLQLSRIVRRPLEKEKVNLSDISKKVVDNLKQEHPDRNVKIKIQNNLKTKGDKSLIKIVMENLIGNSWKFTDAQKKPKIEIGKIKKDDKKVFYVKDNGAGFNMEYADKLFAPFQRLHTENEFEGTGIGLSIVSRIIHRHGGEIWADSEEGKGSVFYFTLGEK